MSDAKKTLIEIDREYRTVVEGIEAGGGELTPENEAALDATCTALCDKVDAYGMVSERLKSEAEFWKLQKEHCMQAEKTFSNALARLRERMKLVLTNHPDKSLQGALFRFFLAPGKDTLLIDEEKIPREYKISRMVLEVDKEKVLRALQQGIEVPGAALKTDNFSLRTGKPKP